MTARMPAEFAPHERTVICWPSRVELYGDLMADAEDAHAQVARAIADFEPVSMIVSPLRPPTVPNFLPWSAFRSLPSSKNVKLPPKAADRWRFNLFRVKRPGGREAPKTGAVEAAWSKPPGDTFHAPEVFRDLVFEQ